MSTTNLQARALAAFYASGVPVLLWGPPGVGKTAMISSVADKLGLPMETVIGSVREPADFNGLPVVNGDEVVMTPPDWFKRLLDAGKGVLFADELSTSPPATQAAMLRLFAERAIDRYRLTDRVMMIAAANEAADAADGWELAPPTANRFAHLTFAYTAEQWVQGMTSGWDTVAVAQALDAVEATDERKAEVRARVAAFIANKPQMLHQMPTDPTKAGKAWPSPRTWSYVAEALAYVRDDDTDLGLFIVKALVGEGAAIEFASWVRFDDLPNPGDLLANPQSLVVDKRIDRLYTILQSVVAVAASRGSKTAWAQAWKVCAAAAEKARADVAASAVRSLMLTRPDGAFVDPANVKPFLQILSDAGQQAPTEAVAA